MTDHPWIIVLAVVGIAAIITAVVLYLVYRRSLARGAAMILANTGNVATRYKLHGEDLVGLRYTFSSDVRPIQMIRATKPTEKRPSTTKQKAASSHVSESTSKVKAGRKGLKSASRAASSVNKFARFLPSDMRKSVTSATSQVQRAEGKVQKVENTERRVEGVAGRATHAIPSSKTQSAATLTVPTETDFQPDQTAEAAITCDLGQTPVLEPGSRLQVSCSINSPMRVRQKQIEYRIVSVASDHSTDEAVLEGVFDGSRAASLRLWTIVLAALGIIWGGYALYWLLTYGI